MTREYTIQVHTDHPEVETIVRWAADAAAMLLGESGHYHAVVNLFDGTDNIDAWEIEP